MSEKEFSQADLLRAAMAVDRNIEQANIGLEREEFLKRIGLHDLAPVAAPAPAPTQAPSLPQPLAAAIQALGENGAAGGSHEPLAALYPDEEEDENHGTGENGNLQGQGGGDQGSLQPLSEQGESVQVSDQGQGGEALTGDAGAPAPVIPPVVEAAPAVVTSPWEATDTPAATTPAAKKTTKGK